MNHHPRLAALVLSIFAAAPIDVTAQDVPRTTVGMRGTIDQVVLPGTELRARAIDDPAAPIVLRILATWPHGSDWRYDLEYAGFEPGRHDLAAYLERSDGSSTDDLPEIPVEVVMVLPPGQIEPNPVLPSDGPRLGGYTALMIVGAVVWVVGLVAILFVGRRRRRDDAAAASRPITLADRLRPRVEQAMRGELDESGKAELERLLLAHWRARRGLAKTKAAAAIATLRDDPEAGPLLRQLEEWLHKPGPHAAVDVAALLRPYRDVVDAPVPLDAEAR